MNRKFVQIYLSKLFRLLGKTISRYPIYFIIIPLLVTVILLTGCLRLKKLTDIDKLFVAENGRFMKTRQKIDKVFPMNMSYFADIARITHKPKGPTIYVMTNQSENMLQEHILREIKILDNIIKNVTITKNKKEIGYVDLCGMIFGKCFENPIIVLISRREKGLSNWNRIKYPVDIDPLTLSYDMYGLNLGGVTVDDDDYVKTAEAIRLTYVIDETDPEKRDCIDEWVKAVFDRLNQERFEYIRTIPDFLNIMEETYILHMQSILPLLIVSVSLICLFSAVSYLTNSWQRSKPWLGISSCLSAMLAICSSFGFAFYCGLEYSDTNITIPFLVLATEIDDAYILLAAWRSTNRTESVEIRMSETYSEAAVSITLTSLTNFVSYCIGMATPFPIVRLFCAYVAISIIFTYLYQITFFGGCMALSGFHEYNKLCQTKIYVRKDFTENIISCNENTFRKEFYITFFRDKFDRLISWTPMRITIILLYFINLGIGIWGFSNLVDGLDITKIFPSDSSTKAIDIYYKYFTRYSLPIQLIIEEPKNYADRKVQMSIEELIQRIESHSHISSNLTVSWLKYYKMFLKHDIAKFSMKGYDTSTKKDFIEGFRNVFLRFKAALPFNFDVKFNENGTEIVSSRIIFVSENVGSRTEETELMKDLYKITENSEIPVSIFSLFDNVVEQTIIIRTIIQQLILFTMLTIIVVFFIFIPDIFCTLLVTICVVSSIVETIGFMAIWNINLDMISTMILILCVGFSINYPTHFTFAFSNCLKEEMDLKKRIRHSLYMVGFPIFQGSISTILGVFVFALSKMYVFTTFFKIVFIIVIQTSFHSVFVLPVTINVCGNFVKLLQNKVKH